MQRDRLSSWLGNSALVFGSVICCFMATELFLWAHSVISKPAVAAVAPADPLPPLDPSEDIAVPPEFLALEARRHALLTMPEEWKRTSVVVHGARAAYMWQGALHVMNEHSMRWASPFPEKKPGIFRVIVLGDSLTYGAGIAEKDTFTARLNQWVGRDYRIEFLNLGMTGGNSTDMLNNLRELMPSLKPDLVIYAMCLNDFLHVTEGQYSYTYAFPIPEPIERFFISHTRTGPVIAELYDKTLRRFHLRRDFFDDILDDFGGRRERFRREVAEMNVLVRDAGLPPMIAMVVDQFPDFLGRSYKIAQVAEDAFRQADIDLIPTENYYRRYTGKGLYVSRWEGHPDEVANYIWAVMLMHKLLARQDVQQIKRD